MKKTALLCVLALLLGCAAGLMLNIGMLGGRGLLTRSAPIITTNGAVPMAPVIPAETDPADNAPLLKAGSAVLAALRDGDIAALAALVSPERGVTFTPYSTVDPHSDLTFLPDQLTQASASGTKYVWGYTQGKGDPIMLTLPEYLESYAFNADYTKVPIIGVDHVLSSGNSLENVSEAYPEARFLEYYFPSADLDNNGFDWCALKLVFELYDGAYRLVGVIHSEWTI